MPQEVRVGNVADVETVGIAYAPAQRVAKSLEEGARVSYLASAAKEPAYEALPRQTLIPCTMPLRPPKQSPATELAPTAPRKATPLEHPPL